MWKMAVTRVINLTSWLGFTEMKSSEGLTSDSDISLRNRKKIIGSRIPQNSIF